MNHQRIYKHKWVKLGIHNGIIIEKPVEPVDSSTYAENDYKEKNLNYFNKELLDEDNAFCEYNIKGLCIFRKKASTFSIKV